MKKINSDKIIIFIKNIFKEMIDLMLFFIKLAWIIIAIWLVLFWLLYFENWYKYHSLDVVDIPGKIIIKLEKKSWNFVFDTKNWNIEEYSWEIKNKEKNYWKYCIWVQEYNDHTLFLHKDYHFNGIHIIELETGREQYLFPWENKDSKIEKIIWYFN